MKNKYIALCLIVAAMLTSCGDEWLDQEPSTSTLTETSISNAQDCYASLNGIYSTMQDAYAYSGRLVYYGDAAGDDMQALSATKRTGDAYLLSYSESNVRTSYWLYPYSMINACNNILAQFDKIKDGDAELLDFYKGQTLALRGMFLFDLTKIFGYPYKKDNGASLGVPVVTELLNRHSKPARNTVAEDYTQIITDLEDACRLLDNETGNSFVKGKMNRIAALTLLSRVYLYHGDDAKALETAEKAIDAAGKAKYKLWTNAEYATAWADDCDENAPGETLLEIVNLTDDSPGKEALGYLHNESGYYDIICTSSFYAMMQEDPSDVRNKVVKVSSKRKAPFCNKYQPQGTELIQNANIRLIRLSEAYLNAAEAAVKTNDKEKAIYYLDAIVNRANPKNHVSGTVTLDQVMKERRKELFGEGHRLFDALRDGGSVVRTNVSNSKISKAKHLSMSDEKMNFNWDYYRCILPIPISEIDANQNIKQNPGY